MFTKLFRRAKSQNSSKDISQTSKPQKSRKDLNEEVPKKRRKRKPLKVKANNPPTPYSLFIWDVRNKLFTTNVTFAELTAICSQRWKQMSIEEKQKYIEMAKDIRENMFRLRGKAKRCHKKYSKLRKKNKYWNFAKMMRPIVTQEMRSEGILKPEMKDVNRYVAIKWSQLSPEEQNQYKSISTN